MSLHHVLLGIPCPSWIAETLDAHQRRRRLVLDIWALSDKTTAFAVLWLARVVALRSRHPYSEVVEQTLRAVRGRLSS